MKNITMLKRAEPREILETIIEERIPAIMSYLSRGKWHVAKVNVVRLGANRLYVEIAPRKKPHPLNIKINQPVGFAIKFGYGKFIFDTKVMSLEPSLDRVSGGVIVFEVPTKIEMVQRRSFFRVSVPKAMKVNAQIWHRNTLSDEMENPNTYWQGTLVDISAGGAQLALPAEFNPDLKKGQFLGVRFTPMPYEKPIQFNAQVRCVLPTADESMICYGVQIVGLEATEEGRLMLERLCSVIESYHQMNQSSVKHQDFQSTCR